MRFVHADKKIEYDKSFISIEVNDGDTLTSIAQDYAVSTTEYDAYISEVKNINNLENDTIHAGCYLLVPVYEAAE
jgi:LysM repeat protein